MAAAAAAAVVAGGCSTHHAPHAVVTIERTLGPGDVAQSPAERVTGHFAVRLLDARCGITYLTGTHAEFDPRNPLCRIRERVRSLDATYHSFGTSRQQLVLENGATVTPSIDAMNIKRQPDAVDVGARDVLELDVYFEPPPGIRPDGVRIYGDTDPGTSVAPAGPPSVVMRLELRVPPG